MEKSKPVRKYTKRRAAEKERQKREEKIFAVFKKEGKKQLVPPTPSAAVVALDCEMVGSFNADLLDLSTVVFNCTACHLQRRQRALVFLPYQRGSKRTPFFLLAENYPTFACPRVSICDGDGHKLLDEIVRPPGRVTDYREHITGLTPQVIFERGITFAAARALVRTIIQDKILIGHAVHNDLQVALPQARAYSAQWFLVVSGSLSAHGQVLALRHPLHLIRDTSTYKRLRPPNYHGTPSLRHLVRHWFGEAIQTGVHDSLEDCRAALRMYHLFRDEWEHQFTAIRNSGPLKVQRSLQAMVEEEDLGSPEVTAATVAT